MKADSVVVVVQECRHVGLKLKGKNTVFTVHDLGVPGGADVDLLAFVTSVLGASQHMKEIHFKATYRACRKSDWSGTSTRTAGTYLTALSYTDDTYILLSGHHVQFMEPFSAITRVYNPRPSHVVLCGPRTFVNIMCML